MKKTFKIFGIIAIAALIGFSMASCDDDNGPSTGGYSGGLAAPTGLTARTVSSSEIYISWNAVAGAAKYNIYNGISSSGLSFISSTTATNATNNNLPSNTTVYYQVTAVNANGIESARSNIASATTSGGSTTPPSNNHRYQVFENNALSWTQAKAYCESIGGHLVTITSLEKQTTVYNLVKNGTKNQYWIGGYRSGTGFAWVTGEKWDYTNWAPGEPNNDDGSENCLQMLRSSGKWNDEGDNGEPRNPSYSLANTGFICEWD